MQERSLLLNMYPPFMRTALTNVVSAQLDDRLRKAMMFHQAPSSYQMVFHAAMEVRRWLLRYLALPRPVWQKGTRTPRDADVSSHGMCCPQTSSPHSGTDMARGSVDAISIAGAGR